MMVLIRKVGPTRRPLGNRKVWSFGLGSSDHQGPIVGTNLCINLHSHAKTNAADLPFLCREQVIIRKCAGAFDEFISRILYIILLLGDC